MIEALIFDFDGLIIDTEWPDFQGWQEICQAYGVDLTIETWLPCIGTGITTQVFDPYEYLAERYGQALDRATVLAQRGRRHMALIDAQPILPGVEALIVEARRRGLGLAVASSSPRSWVAGHLDRVGLLEHFDLLFCGNEVPHTKPYPDLYLAALEGLGVQAGQAIAFEDSLNGMTAAQRAGIYCVVVSNPLTQYMPLEQADLRLSSLADLSLDELIALASKGGVAMQSEALDQEFS
jgi:HAD superfamily hydrolase (TIGR01509 family)